jgi:hypothetical protein
MTHIEFLLKIELADRAEIEAARRQMERASLRRARTVAEILDAIGGTAAARRLGMSRPNVYRIARRSPAAEGDDGASID